MSNPFLTPYHETILNALSRYHLLTAEQVNRGWGTPSGLTRAQMFLKQLRDWEYIQGDLWLSRSSRYGRSPTVYNLAAKGFAFLHEQGKTIEEHYRPGDYKVRSHYALAHTLAVNDFLIATEIFVRNTSRVELASIQHERELKKTPFKAKDQNGHDLVFSPDAWIDLQVIHEDGPYAESFEVEIDRGTEDQRRWKSKIRTILSWIGEPAKAQFGTADPTITILAVRGDDQVDSDEARFKRKENLRRWTEEVLEAEKRVGDGELFFFTSADPAHTAPDLLYCGPSWSQPFHDEAVPLLASQKELTHA